MKVETIGARIRRLRMAHQLSQKQLALDIGLNPSSLNQIEKGKRIPGSHTVSGLAARLGVSRDLLMDGEASAAPAPRPEREHAERDPLSAAVQAAIREELAGIVAAFVSALGTWYEAHAPREIGSAPTDAPASPGLPRARRRSSAV
jgi:transcriptional regulator with XRE-family HTH domain